MNFPAFFSETDLTHRPEPNARQRLGRVLLQDDEWHTEIQQLPNTPTLVRQLDQEGGYAITHVGRLLRADRGSFSMAATSAVMGDLHHFLSLARGAWTTPTLSVGFDEHGNRTVEEWGVRLDSPWEPRMSWFDKNHGEALVALYPGFISLLRDSNLGEPVRNALYWYLRSNRAGEGAGIDSGIILSQAALERLAVAYLKSKGISLSRKANAKEHLREMLRRFGIPTAIPAHLSNLYETKGENTWVDVPQAITKVRNEIVHPRALESRLAQGRK
jgi:hypothetical protein